MEQLGLFSPMIALVVTMLAIVACPLVAGRKTATIGRVTAVGIAVALLLALRVAGRVADGGMAGLAPPAQAGMLIADNLSIAFQMVLLLFLAAVGWLWWMGSAATETNVPEFLILLLGSALGMALMASTSNLLMMIVAIETASLPSYALVGFDKKDRLGAEASLKYMIFGAVSAAIMLYGASLLYGLTGSLNAAEVARYTVDHFTSHANQWVLSLGLLCFLAGVAFKISAVPFHFWCPDAFEGAKIEVTTWLSVVSKAAGLVLLIRLVLLFCAAVPNEHSMAVLAPAAWLIGIMAAVTCTVGNFAAFKQSSVKRLLAYSSIAHAGYMMMAAAVFLHPRSEDPYVGVSALLTYVVIYLFMNLGAFGVTAFVVWESGGDRIESFTGLMRRSPWLAVPMVICLMSLVGLPPFAGFLGKWWVLVALGRLGGALGWGLAIAAVVNTLISLYYYLRLVVQMTLRDDGRPAMRSSWGGLVLANGCAAALLFLFVLANPLKATVDRFSHRFYHPAASAGVARTAGMLP
jgi:NADH-quinone oxidoreductase subunit N